MHVAQLDEHLLEATKPFVAALLQDVEPLEQARNPRRVALSKAVGLLHVHVDVVQLAVEVGVSDVNPLKLEDLEGGKSKNGEESGPLGRGGEHLVKINTGTLAKTLGKTTLRN
jgi:hypothetical protein